MFKKGGRRTFVAFLAWLAVSAPLGTPAVVEACRRLGWMTIPAIIRPYRGDPGALPHGRGNACG